MFKNLNPLAFAASFAFAMLLVYCFEPAPQVIIKFPTPDNAGKIVYKNNDDDGCYRYRAKTVDCKLYKGRVKEQPVDVG